MVERKAEESIYKVTEFLRSRGIIENVLERFSEEKMDIYAIINSTNLELKEMGLSALGDILALKRFAHEISKRTGSASGDEKRLLLEELLNNPGVKRKSITDEAATKRSSKTVKSQRKRKVMLGWIHYDSKKKKHIPVRAGKGGGSRQVEFDVQADQLDVIKMAKSLFFPDGSSCFGAVDNMSFGIANYQHEDLSHVNVLGDNLPFTLGRYLEASKFTRVRLYLKSNCKETDDKHGNYDDDSDDDFELSKSVYLPRANDLGTVSSKDTSAAPLHQHLESLVDCRNLISEQNQAYEDSLKADQEKKRATEVEKAKKRGALLAEINDVQRQENLRAARSKRVPPVPSKNEEQLTIQVRHITLGLVTRAFKKEEKIATIYDWIGSLSLTPEQFILCDYSRKTVDPSQPISKVSSDLYMTESQSTPEMEVEINFKGFGNLEDGNNVTLTPEPPGIVDLTTDHLTDGDSFSYDMWEEIDHIDVNPPEQLLQQDESTDSDSEKTSSGARPNARPAQYEAGRYFRQVQLPKILGDKQNGKPTLEKNRLKLLANLEEEGAGRVIVVERWNVVAGMMKLYSTDDGLLNDIVQFQFKQEMGCDFGGVSREVFSSFWKACSLQFFEGNENFYVLRHSGVSKEECATLGKIIHHGYLLTGFFPVILSEAYVQAMLLGEDDISDEFVVQNYIKYLASYEGDRLSKILHLSMLEKEDRDFILELEDRYGMRVSPNASNLKDIAAQMARSELIEIPMHTMAKLKQGMTCSHIGEKLWKDISGKDIDQIYQLQSPSPSKVASLLKTENEDLTKEESKIFDFLRRYVMMSDQKRCEAFLKYCTGSNTIIVGNITIYFYKTTAKEPFPKAHTCTAVLEMPSSGYPTFHFFKSMLDSLLDNPSTYQFTFD